MAVEFFLLSDPSRSCPISNSKSLLLHVASVWEKNCLCCVFVCYLTHFMHGFWNSDVDADVSIATGVAEGTIRNSYKDLYPHMSKIIPSWYANEEDLKNLSSPWKSWVNKNDKWDLFVLDGVNGVMERHANKFKFKFLFRRFEYTFESRISLGISSMN